MTIQINGVYEYDSGRTDWVHQCPEVYRIYVYKKIRKYYKCFINQIGTDFIAPEHVSGKCLRERCKYMGQAHAIWKDLFQVFEVRSSKDDNN